MATQIYILDTTLRDGQQSPGAGMSYEDNLHYAHLAHKLKIDILEAGFPSASNTDFNIVSQIAKDMAAIKSDMKISGLCQLREDQVHKTMEALAPSLAINRGRIHIYVPVDPELMPVSLGNLANDKPLIIGTVNKLIKIMTSAGFEVEFSPEGYSRMRKNFDFTTDVIRAAIEAGASIINCPDTIGGASRYEGEDYFVNKIKQHAAIIKQEFPGQNIIWSAHCHNDFGTALDNTLTAVFEGAVQQIEGCINGVGERAGNVSLEQCIMNIRQFGNLTHLSHKVYTNADISYLKDISDFIAEKMLPRQPHSPITGKNAASHTSGGHINAILKNPMAYQPFDPKQIGSEISFVFGPLSGSNHARQIITTLGYKCTEEEKVAITQAIKDYYQDRRKGITDEELVKAYKAYRSPIRLDSLTYAKDAGNTTTLTLHGKFFDLPEISVSYKGKGSALSTINNAIATHFPGIAVEDYNSYAEGHTIDALCTSNITVSLNGSHRFHGRASDEDIEISAVKAFIDAVNNAYVETKFALKNTEK
ncbi:MAG: 2-isopropylmalate synthase [Burkholderiales bacterium]|jgi:2-isopropylmalate synthase|nr:2-isopropylmalate synthase [Burkholderiales bacterium]